MRLRRSSWQLVGSFNHFYGNNVFSNNLTKLTEARTFEMGPRDGTIFLYDLKGSGFKHLLRATISSVRKGIDFLQSGSPLNVTFIHIFNATSLMDLIFGEKKLYCFI